MSDGNGGANYSVTNQTNSGTINNARLWDPNVIRDTYSTLQNLQTYYQIGDVDVDRYLIDGKVRQVLIAARGLNSADLPSQSFVGRRRELERPKAEFRRGDVRVCAAIEGLPGVGKT